MERKNRIRRRRHVTILVNPKNSKNNSDYWATVANKTSK